MSLPSYPEYKPSGVEWLGEVPGHWAELPLKNVASYNDDVIDEATDADHEILYVDISSVDRAVGIVAKEAMPFSAAPSRARRKVKDGDVIVSTVRTYLRAIARIVEPEDNLVVSTGFAVIRPSDRIFHGYLGYLLSANFFVDEVISKSVGVSYPAINASDLVGIKVPVPSIQEQQAIATFLDRETGKIDALIAEQRRLVELLAEKRQAVILHAVTKGLNSNAKMKDSGIEWLGKVPEHWEVKRIKHIKSESPNSFVDGPFGSNLKSEHFIDGGDVYVIESNFATQGKLEPSELKTITNKHFETIRRSEVKSGDIVIAKIGAQFGKSSILPPIDKQSVVLGNSMKLTVNKKICETLWAYWQLFNLKASGEIDLLNNGSAQPALSLGAMNELIFLLPSKKEQGTIITFLETETEKFDALTLEANRAVALLQERRSALISAAVTGKIDVRTLSPSPLPQAGEGQSLEVA